MGDFFKKYWLIEIDSRRSIYLDQGLKARQKVAGEPGKLIFHPKIDPGGTRGIPGGLPSVRRKSMGDFFKKYWLIEIDSRRSIYLDQGLKARQKVAGEPGKLIFHPKVDPGGTRRVSGGLPRVVRKSLGDFFKSYSVIEIDSRGSIYSD